jgi:hypothetical protein
VEHKIRDATVIDGEMMLDIGRFLQSTSIEERSGRKAIIRRIARSPSVLTMKCRAI